MSDIIFKTLLLKGENGDNIKDIKKTSTNGLVDTYTVTLNNGDTTTFKVTNGKSIVDIKKTGSTGLVDTYTIAYNDGTTSTFEVTNGEGLQNLQVGGRNLYQDTKYFNNPSVWLNYGAWHKTGETYDGFTVMANNEKWHGLFQIIHPAKEGETYTFSAYIKNADGVQATIYTGSGEVYCSPATLAIPQSKDFVKYAVTFRVTSVGNNGLVAARIESDVNEANKIEVCGLKLERGNILTDWSPAPEDLETVAITNSDIDTILNS